MARDLADKVILITGASSGIGAATARACTAAGMRVTLAARREEKLRDVAREIDAAAGGDASLVASPRSHWCVCDVDDEEAVRRLFADSWNAFGRLDAVFANAGYGLAKPILETGEEEHRAIFETNYFGTIRTLQAAVPRLRQTADGLRHVLVCSSAASEIALPMYGAYSATKAAQDSAAGALRGELAPEGFRVTTVHPVGTTTEFFETASDRSGSNYSANTPPGLMQTPEKVADAIVACLRRPKPEVWPMPTVRFALAATTAMPRLAAWIMRRQAKRSQTAKS